MAHRNNLIWNCRPVQRPSTEYDLEQYRRNIKFIFGSTTASDDGCKATHVRVKTMIHYVIVKSAKVFDCPNVTA